MKYKNIKHAVNAINNFVKKNNEDAFKNIKIEINIKEERIIVTNLSTGEVLSYTLNWNKEEMKKDILDFAKEKKEVYIEKEININLLEIEQKLENEELVYSCSPYSNSVYFHGKDEYIDWGIKPENSLRIADHWNWSNGNHCPVHNAGKKTINGLKLGIQIDGKYQFIECDEDELKSFFEKIEIQKRFVYKRTWESRLSDAKAMIKFWDLKKKRARTEKTIKKALEEIKKNAEQIVNALKKLEKYGNMKEWNRV